LKEICPEFNVRKTEFAGENRETYWKNIFSFKLLKVSKQMFFFGMIETDGVALCVHYRRLKTDRPVPPSAAPVTKDAENKEADPATQEVQDNDLVLTWSSMKMRRRRIPRRRKCRITTLSLT